MLLEEMGFSESVEYLRVAEAFLGGSVGTNNTCEVRAGTMGCKIVADSAEVLEKLLTLAGVSFNLLLGGHLS